MTDRSTGDNSNQHLKSFVERIESREADKREIAEDIKEIYAEAKGSGFDVKALRAVIRIRKQDADKRREEEAVLETYLHTLGMLADLPLGQAAIQRAGVQA